MTEQLLKRGNSVLSQIKELRSKMKRVEELSCKVIPDLTEDELAELFKIATGTLFNSLRDATYEFKQLK
jgi:hypothetical protein